MPRETHFPMLVSESCADRAAPIFHHEPPPRNVDLMLMPLVPFEERVVFIALADHIGDEIQDLFAGEFVGEAFGHQGFFRLLAKLDVRFLNHQRLGFGERVFDDLDTGRAFLQGSSP